MQVSWTGAIEGHVVQNLHTRRGAHLYTPSEAKYFVSGSSDGTIKLWNMITKRCDSTFTSTSGVIVLSISPDNGNVISLLADGRVMTWNMGNNKCEEILKCRIGDVHEISCDYMNTMIEFTTFHFIWRIFPFQMT
jgi:WD40 repeat protein